MRRIFIDTNVLIDLVRKREPFFQEAVAIFSLRKEVKFTSTISIVNLDYILRKNAGRTDARKNIGVIIENFQLLDVNEFIIRQAYESTFKLFTDFEDAVQHYCAMAHSMDAIVTRNEKDYENSELPVYSPKEFIKIFGE